MFGIIWVLIWTLVSAFRSRHQLVLENLALRQQLAAFKARGRHRASALPTGLSGFCSAGSGRGGPTLW